MFETDEASCKFAHWQFRTVNERLNAIHKCLSFADQDSFSGDVSFGYFET